MTEQTKIQIGQRRQAANRKRRKVRLLFLIFVLFLGFGAVVFHKDRISAINEMLHWLQQNNPDELTASPLPSSIKRGEIYDRNFRPLATTYETYSIYARPLEMEKPTVSANILADLLGEGKKQLIPNLKDERGYVWVAKDIDRDTADTIKQRNLKGIYQNVETKRFYPNSMKAAHAVGFVESGQGLDGIEFQYNAILRGDEISSGELKTLNLDPQTGLQGTETHLVLHLDLMLQTKIEHFLYRRMKISGASSGAFILMNADTGAILAMASFPSFDPNRYWEFPSSSLKNHALTEPVYPGELAFIFQQAAALDSSNEKITGSAAESGEIAPVNVIVPEKRKKRRSSVAPRVDYVDPVYLAEFVKSLGFNSPPTTDLSLKDEVPVPADLNITNPSFSSSALRLLNGFTALVNGGRLLAPHLLHSAYQKGSAAPLQLAVSEQKKTLKPQTSGDLAEFLAAKWLKLHKGDIKADTPMFFETRNYSTSDIKNNHQKPEDKEPEFIVQVPYLSQSVMLGAVPWKKPKLTMIGVLSYPENGNDVYPEALETLGRKFSFLSPDQDMVRKMLHVAAMSSPVPSPDFWQSDTNLYAKNSDSQLFTTNTS
ncbi:MAG: hypothetical protein JRF02_00760, partial [Deltaproteobacteria bacterium]|nr:hypothetical protein [Deltaproteobacteria bacterium]